jgi:hypothetical protein
MAWIWRASELFQLATSFEALWDCQSSSESCSCYTCTSYCSSRVNYSCYTCDLNCSSRVSKYGIVLPLIWWLFRSIVIGIHSKQGPGARCSLFFASLDTPSPLSASLDVRHLGVGDFHNAIRHTYRDIIYIQTMTASIYVVQVGRVIFVAPFSNRKEVRVRGSMTRLDWMTELKSRLL